MDRVKQGESDACDYLECHVPDPAARRLMEAASFAIFDLDDVNWDSMVFVDNFQWSCDGSGPPTTIPVD